MNCVDGSVKVCEDIPKEECKDASHKVCADVPSKECEDVCKQEFIEEVLCQCPQVRVKDRMLHSAYRKVSKKVTDDACDDIPENVTKEVTVYKTEKEGKTANSY